MKDGKFEALRINGIIEMLGMSRTWVRHIFFGFVTESIFLTFFQVCDEKRRKYSRAFHVVARKTCYYFRQCWQRQGIVGIHS